MNRQPENFPETVKEVRRQLALSQEKLAHALGVSADLAFFTNEPNQTLANRADTQPKEHQ
ncbi:hypothetical protein BJI67_06560 [Acidihalobacter aeolianus]|uniref:Uncharacterized protein n=1 Tax=Acidihalobacter aeolianus TaxID=2792603 RepID=A0A1D8K753_9GAMM|nr:hypothetical protein [Acidihalobacter aeolianus]AOV16766.1 hypothetical protein BJI67_06560 [Acidihalobacter aeolianus]